MPKQQLQHFNYPPWIGKQYGKSKQINLMICGRSYYDARYRDKAIQKYIEDHAKGKHSDPFFTALEIVLSERNHWKGSQNGMSIDRKKFWNTVSYYQFIQGILNDGYSPIGKSLWSEGQELFKTAIVNLKPDIVIMCGQDVFGHMPTMGGHNGRIYKAGTLEMKSWILDIGNSECWISGIDSPRSSSFDPDQWKEIYTQFISDYKNKFKLTSFSFS